jgi:hypothetical protein
LEAYLGRQYKDISDREVASGGFFSAALSVFGAVGGFVLLGPVGVVGGALLGGAVGASVDGNVRMRTLTDREWAVAVRVFGAGSLPPRADILITDLIGVGGRAFVFPGSAMARIGAVVNPLQLIWLPKNPNLFANKILINLGTSGFFDAASPYGAGVPGATLVHELTHVWQVHHRSFQAGFVCEGLYVQATQGRSAYLVTPGQQWREYGLEQQGTLVEEWYERLVAYRGGAESQFDPSTR